MGIKERLIRIITSEGLTSSAFADAIGVQRSSISHILSGRNKPSIDFLEKVFKSFPKYNAEWLIMGTGEVYKKPKQPSLFDFDTPINQVKSNEFIEPISEEIPLNDIKTKDEHQIENEKIQNTVKTNENVKGEQDFSTQKTSKKIDKIIILYSDRSFIEYHPE